MCLCARVYVCDIAYSCIMQILYMSKREPYKVSKETSFFLSTAYTRRVRFIGDARERAQAYSTQSSCVQFYRFNAVKSFVIGPYAIRRIYNTILKYIHIRGCFALFSADFHGKCIEMYEKAVARIYFSVIKCAVRCFYTFAA